MSEVGIRHCDEVVGLGSLSETRWWVEKICVGLCAVRK